MPPMSTPSTNPAPEQQSTKPKRLGNTFAYASVLCSLAFWVGFVLSYFPTKIRFDFNAFNWLRLMAAAILLAVVARDRVGGHQRFAHTWTTPMFSTRIPGTISL